MVLNKISMIRNKNSILQKNFITLQEIIPSLKFFVVDRKANKTIILEDTLESQNDIKESQSGIEESQINHHMINSILGLSLIQSLISLTISCFLLTTILYGYHAYKTAYLKSYQKMRAFSSLSTIWQFLKNDILNTGYRGCRSLDKNHAINRLFIEPHRTFKLIPDTPRIVYGIRASPGACFGRLPERICQRVVPESDILILYWVVKEDFTLKTPMQSSDDPFILEESKNNRMVSEKDLLLIDDCQNTDIFMATQVRGNEVFHGLGLHGNSQASLSKPYPAGASVVVIETVVYYLGFSNQRSKGTSHALFRDDLTQSNRGAQEIAEDITNFNVEYGVGDKSPVQSHKAPQVHYYKAPDVQHWEKVGWLKIKVGVYGEKIPPCIFALRNWNRPN